MSGWEVPKTGPVFLQKAEIKVHILTNFFQDQTIHHLLKPNTIHIERASTKTTITLHLVKIIQFR